jgi:transglutaminase-like putative cysteine protease
MKPKRDSGTLSVLGVWLTIAAFLAALLPHLGNMPPGLIVLVFAAAAWRALAAVRGWGPPGLMIRVLMTFGGLGLVVLEFGTFWGRRAATVLLCVMLAAKLTEMFRLRDARLVASLCFFLIATRFLFSQELPLLIYLLVGCWIAFTALVQLQRDEDAPAAAVAAGLPRNFDLRPLLLGGAGLVAVALPFALVLFMLFPRLGSPLWGVPDNALDGRTGISEEMSPGSIVSLFIDDSPAFRVEFDGAVPPPDERYWRGPVLWRLDGQTWKRVYFSNRPATEFPEPDEAPYRYTVLQEPTERRWLFALDYPAMWPADAQLSVDYELVRDEPVTSVIRYRIASQPDFIDTPRLMEVYRRIALELPEGSNPRTREFAQALRAEHTDDRALVDAVLAWFSREPFFYSLEAPPLGRNGADEFLFDLRVGYCEYYASAFAILMRAAGVPTRIVTGYQGGYWQEGADYLLVRQSDAHAWNEVWLDGQGWVRVDPTAAVSPERIMDGARNALPAARGWFGSEWMFQLRNRFDRIQHLWNRWVLGFNAERQQRMLDRFGLDDLPPGLYAVLMLVVAGLALLPLIRLLQRELRRSIVSGPLARAWARMIKRLVHAGLAAADSMTPLELAREVAPRLANGDEFRALAQTYSDLRYGPLTHSGEDQVRLLKTLLRWRPRKLNSGPA